MATKKYLWDVYRFKNGSYEYVMSYRSGAIGRTAFKDFNAYISESLDDGDYVCERRVANKGGKRPVIGGQVYR